MSDTNESGETQFGRGEASGQPRIIPKSAKEALRPEQVPEPPSRRRSRKARSQLVIFLNFVMTVIVFATLVGVEGANLLVRGLDCVDGTPLLDLKPDRTLFTPIAPPQPGDFETE